MPGSGKRGLCTRTKNGSQWTAVRREPAVGNNQSGDNEEPEDNDDLGDNKRILWRQQDGENAHLYDGNRMRLLVHKLVYMETRYDVAFDLLLIHDLVPQSVKFVQNSTKEDWSIPSGNMTYEPSYVPFEIFTSIHTTVWKFDTISKYTITTLIAKMIHQN